MCISGEDVPSVRTEVSVWATGVDGWDRDGFELSTPESLDTLLGSTVELVSDILRKSGGVISVEFFRGGEAVMSSSATWGYSGWLGRTGVFM